MVHHISPENSEASCEVETPGNTPHHQRTLVHSQILAGLPDGSTVWPCPGVGDDMVSSSVWEEVDTACENGCLINPTLPTSHCPVYHEIRIWLEGEGIISGISVALQYVGGV